GHNAIGCGRVFAQGAKLVNDSISSGALFRGQVWTDVVKNCISHGSTLHFMGLFSDGNVHSHIDHLKAMLVAAKKAGVKKARIHVLLDGRDVGGTSALDYIDPFEAFLSELSSDGQADYRIASGGGRMKVTMDRYNADWGMVQLGWSTHVAGLGPAFKSAHEAVVSHRNDNPGIIDQDLPPFVVVEAGKPVGKIVDGDSVVFFNFRGDRAIEISKAFEYEDLKEFKRGPRPDVKYAGMMQYDGDLLIPKNFLVTPPAIDRTVGEYLAGSGVRQLAISETQKFGHVTYFFNGNRSGKFDELMEDYVEIPSDRVSFDQRPWMKAADITDYVVNEIVKGSYPFIRLNFPNGDMVGHTGVYQATQVAVEAVDLCIGRIMQAVRATQGILLVSADHGNADEMFEHDPKTGRVKVEKKTGEKVVRTAHSLNPVPVHIYDPSGTASLSLSDEKDLGISSLAATCIRLLGYEPPDDYTPSIVKVGNNLRDGV
ncbi:MAG: 2,3-bisphosphoglycerate-independent phosphoglycerate mutase, partial [bacterium]